MIQILLASFTLIAGVVLIVIDDPVIGAAAVMLGYVIAELSPGAAPPTDLKRELCTGGYPLGLALILPAALVLPALARGGARFAILWGAVLGVPPIVAFGLFAFARRRGVPGTEVLCLVLAGAMLTFLCVALYGSRCMTSHDLREAARAWLSPAERATLTSRGICPGLYNYRSDDGSPGCLWEPADEIVDSCG